MAAYLLRRLGQLIIVLIVASIVVWYFLYLIPGDPVSALLGQNATPQQIAYERMQLGLDKPLPLQYWIWLTHIVHGNLGVSFISGVPVTTLLAQRVPASLQLDLLSLALGIVVAVVIGVLAARRPRSWPGWIASGYATLALAVPTFWLGILLVLAFSVGLGWLPATSAFIPIWQQPGEAIKSLVLPVLCLGLYIGGILVRFVRAAMEEALGSDFVRTARMKGVSERRVVLKHALRNATLPTVTMIGLQIAVLIGGTVIVESVFAYPGIGTLVLSSVLQRDYVVLQSVIMILVVAVVVINLAVDIAYAYLDPRVRLSTRSRRRSVNPSSPGTDQSKDEVRDVGVQ